MKTKIVPAYEPESSATMRLTPEDIGILFCLIPNKDIGRFFAEVENQLHLFGDDERRKLIGMYLK